MPIDTCRSASREVLPSAELAGLRFGGGCPVRIVGILNVSPESFYPGSVQTASRAIAAAAERMVAEGADMIDVGAQSTAPYKQGAIDEATEIARMESAVTAVVGAVSAPVSIDTQRASVARAAMAAGGSIVNDVSGLQADPEMATVAAGAAGLIVVAYEEGRSAGDPVDEVRRCLATAIGRARAAGVRQDRILADPGIGFFRQCSRPWFEVDAAVLGRLAEMNECGYPLLIGASRKSFLGEIAGRQNTADRLSASLAAAVAAVLSGAAAIRTHDVAATRDAVRVAEAVRAGRRVENSV